MTADDPSPAGEAGHTWPCPRFYVTEDRKACTCRPAASGGATDGERGPVLVARCENFREVEQRACTGSLTFRWGQSQAACDTCGAWCGIAVATWVDVHPSAEVEARVQAAANQRAAEVRAGVLAHRDPGVRPGDDDWFGKGWNSALNFIADWITRTDDPALAQPALDPS